MKEQVIGIGEARTVTHGEILVTYALGSCIGICLWDEDKRFGAMAHVVLPTQKTNGTQTTYKYVETAIPALIETMLKKGSMRHHIIAKIAGGAEMFPPINEEWRIGNQNITLTKNLLRKEHIPIKGEDTGKHHGRTIRFHTDNGALEVHSIRHGVMVI